MRRILLLAPVLICLAFLGLAAGMLSAQSTPPVPALSSPSWQLDFVFDKPQRFVIASSADYRLHVYWAVHYTVTNNTGQDVFFNPIFELRTDTGRILKPVAVVDPALFAQLQKAVGDALMVNPMLMAGRLLQGDDNARSSAALFTDLPDDARGFDLYVAGLSGETATQMDPLTHKLVVLQKTLDLNYSLPGQAINIEPSPQLISRTWVMR
ncbi:MAG TPA: hypothetical protein VMG59_01785 [Phycisphaerae bacterium]|nr:hypothetical protein [Phycisphaerae bacterium]